MPSGAPAPAWHSVQMGVKILFWISSKETVLVEPELELELELEPPLELEPELLELPPEEPIG
jgi:hypothetical protein